MAARVGSLGDHARRDRSLQFVYLAGRRRRHLHRQARGPHEVDAGHLRPGRVAPDNRGRHHRRFDSRTSARSGHPAGRRPPRGHQLRTGTLSVEQRINQRTTCEFESLWTLTVADSHLLTEDGVRIALEDGAEFLTLELHRPRLPRFGDTLSIDLPHTSFRQRVLDRRPLVYWALDERPGRTHVRDWSGNGRCGAVSAGVLLRHRQSRKAAVPYGGAPRMNTGPISLADFPLPDECTVQVWLDLSRFKPSGTEMIIDLPGPVGVKRRLDSELRLVGPGGAEQTVSWPGGSGWHLLTVILAGRHWVVRIDDRTVVDEPLTADAGAMGTLTLGFENRQGECECEWWIDEFSVVPYALTADEVAGDYAARAHLRVFDGVVLDPSIRGREHSGEADVRVHGAGQGMLLERAAVTHPVVTDPDASIGDTMDGLLTDRAPESGLNTDGVHFQTPAGRQVSAGRQVYALQTLYEVFRHLAETGGGNLWVAPWGEIQAVPRSDVPASGVRLDGMKCSNSESMDDSQHLRTTQVLAGAAGARGETVEWFTGDGAKKKFGPLRYPPDTVLDIRVDGASEPWTGDAPPWTVSADDFTLVRNAAPPAPGASPPGPDGTNVMVSYRSDFPIVAEVESEDGRRLYGRWVRIDEDRTADDVPLALERARTRLDRHDTPAKRLSVTTVRGALGPLVVGGLARCHFPRLHEIDDLDMLVDTVRTRVQAGADAELVHDVELVADGYESRFLDYLREIGKITTPFRLAAGKRAEASTRHNARPARRRLRGRHPPRGPGRQRLRPEHHARGVDAHRRRGHRADERAVPGEPAGRDGADLQRPRGPAGRGDHLVGRGAALEPHRRHGRRGRRRQRHVQRTDAPSRPAPRAVTGDRGVRSPVPAHLQRVGTAPPAALGHRRDPDGRRPGGLITDG